MVRLALTRDLRRLELRYHMIKATLTLDDETVAYLERTASRLSMPKSQVVPNHLIGPGGMVGPGTEDASVSISGMLVTVGP